MNAIVPRKKTFQSELNIELKLSLRLLSDLQINLTDNQSSLIGYYSVNQYASNYKITNEKYKSIEMYVRVSSHFKRTGILSLMAQPRSGEEKPRWMPDPARLCSTREKFAYISSAFLRAREKPRWRHPASSAWPRTPATPTADPPLRPGTSSPLRSPSSTSFGSGSFSKSWPSALVFLGPCD